MTRGFSIYSVVWVVGLLGWTGLAGASSFVSGAAFERRGEKVTALAGAFVSLHSSTGTAVATIRTDRGGRYSFANPPPGRFTITVSKPGYVTRLAAARAGSRIVVDCSAGCDEEAADFELILGGVVAGTVRDTLGEPIQNARVSAVRTDLADGRDAYTRGVTDDRGNFRVAGLPAGQYKLTVEGQTADGDAERYTAPIEVAEGQAVDRLDIVLGTQGSFTIAGRLSGVPVGDNYRTWIALRPIDGSRGQPSAGIASDGSFGIDSVPAGRYAATAYASERGSGTRGDYVLGSLDVAGDIGGLALQPLELASITGMVEVAAGAAPAHAIIEITSNEGLGYDTFRFGGENRQFEVRQLTPGPYRIHSRSTEFYVKGIKQGDRVEPADAVRLSPGENRLTIVIAADQGEVFGLVRDPVNREPLPHASVALKGGSGRHFVRTDQAGRFLFGKVIPGEYRICAWTDIAPTAVWHETAWEAAGCSRKIIPIEAESKIEIDLKAAP
jgi:hypothetical protein